MHASTRTVTPYPRRLIIPTLATLVPDSDELVSKADGVVRWMRGRYHQLGVRGLDYFAVEVADDVARQIPCVVALGALSGRATRLGRGGIG
jgi:hypothetical protein